MKHFILFNNNVFCFFSQLSQIQRRRCTSQGHGNEQLQVLNWMDSNSSKRMKCSIIYCSIINIRYWFANLLIWHIKLKHWYKFLGNRWSKSSRYWLLQQLDWRASCKRYRASSHIIPLGSSSGKSTNVERIMSFLLMLLFK